MLLSPLEIKQPTHVAVVLRSMGVTLRKAHAVLGQLTSGKSAAVQTSEDLFEKHAHELESLGLEVRPIRKVAADPKAVRHSLGISQAEFAMRFGLELDTLQNWEQGRSRPDPAANVLLRVIARYPDVVESVLTEAETPVLAPTVK